MLQSMGSRRVGRDLATEQQFPQERYGISGPSLYKKKMTRLMTESKGNACPHVVM